MTRRAALLAGCLAVFGCVNADESARSCGPEAVDLALAAQCAGEAQALYSFAAEKAAPATLQASLKRRYDVLTDAAKACRGMASTPDRGLVTGFPTEAEIAQERAVARARDEKLAQLRARYGWITRGDVPVEAFGPEQPQCAGIGAAVGLAS
ncbi:hypothetical protein [Rubrimonas cliftonensis]|uniref:Lipoprotein n=1 Tax=Rubrimonas cliftonensis TaxID=89524 RepID=A0A1H4BX48_9RHOB|nr:hypothetical protein [Rubrimonas cliftonensis]SEA52653.1 hypothetical protein SAMN05444370_10687 [Rubrimonas cliftonensis]